MAYDVAGSGLAVASQKDVRGRDRADVWGVFCSVGCAIHCAATPVLISTLPSFSSLAWLADPLFHQFVAVICGVLVARAIIPAWKKHRSDRVAILAISGLSLLFLAAFVLPDDCCNHVSGFAVTGVPAAENELAEPTDSPFRLVSVASSSPTAGATSAISTPIPCDSNLNSEAWGGTLLSDHSLFEAVGYIPGQAILKAQPYLSPLGGVLLILAHVLNIRLRCCNAGGCDSKRE